MNRLKVGIFFNARRNQGGLYQYALTLVHCLAHHSIENSYTVFLAALEEPPDFITAVPIPVVTLPRKAVQWRLAIEYMWMLFGRAGNRRVIRMLPPFSQMNRKDLDLVIYVKPTIHSFMWSYPSVFPIHDLQHLLQPSFPEVSSRGEQARRESIYRNAVPRAAAVLTDSEVGREDVLNCYSVNPSRVHSLPFVAPPYLSTDLSRSDIEQVRSRYSLPPNFFFYPAAFWPHKNHKILLQALRILKSEFLAEVDLVFAGGHSLEFSNLQSMAASLEIGGQVHFLGYVPDEDIYPLYRLALALVMPTYFGPTNIPIIEAWGLDCPVVTSDIRGLREQVGDAGLLAAPDSGSEWASALHRIATDPSLRQTLIARGQDRVESWTPKDFATRLEIIMANSIPDSATRQDSDR